MDHVSCRLRSGTKNMSGVCHDFFFSARALLEPPAFFSVGVLTLALCVVSGSFGVAVGRGRQEHQVAVSLLPPLTAEDIGAGQGAEWRDGRLYVYGDGETGVSLHIDQ